MNDKKIWQKGLFENFYNEAWQIKAMEIWFVTCILVLGPNKQV